MSTLRPTQVQSLSKRPMLAVALSTIFLSIPALIYRFVMILRNKSYDTGWLRSYEVKVPVVSIGNLTAGGTGKTPLTAFFVEEMRRRGVGVGIISRGYGGTIQGQERVPHQQDPETAERFGDEPSWLAAQFPDVPVYVGSQKVDVARRLIDEAPVQLVFADDAFQHRRLRRALDIVVLDATEPEWHYRQLPWGRLREGLFSLRRAHAIIITKVNLASSAQVERLRKSATLQSKGNPKFIGVFEFESVIDELRTRAGEMAVSSGRVLLVSGIGRPLTFETLINRLGTVEVAEHLIYRDHHPYSQQDFKTIEARAIALGVSTIVVTEKDAIKMMDWQPSLTILVSHLVARPTVAKAESLRSATQIGVLHEAVHRLVL